MFGPIGSLTLDELSGFVRDSTIIVVVCAAGWKARGVAETVRNFLNRVEQHMDSMEDFAQTMMSNHLTHIEADLKKIAGRKDDSVDPNLEF